MKGRCGGHLIDSVDTDSTKTSLIHICTVDEESSDGSFPIADLVQDDERCVHPDMAVIAR